MPSTRLNQSHRSLLREFAKANVECVPEQKARDKAYTKAANQTRAAVEKQYPLVDMAILLKYKVAEQDHCIRGGSPTGEFVGFTFDASDTAPVCPSSYCGNRSITFSQTAVDAIAASTLATHALEKARNEKLSRYQSLIISARTFEEILEIWPAAQALASRISAPSTAVVALSEDVRRFISDDNAGAALQ